MSTWTEEELRAVEAATELRMSTRRCDGTLSSPVPIWVVRVSDDVLFGQVWTRPGLSSRDRSLLTVAALTTAGNTEQLTYHLGLARQNGAAETELTEAITHLAFYAGWPRAISAMAVARDVLRND